jgi:tetratricopeptide (TPR) repeat protein
MTRWPAAIQVFCLSAFFALSGAAQDTGARPDSGESEASAVARLTGLAQASLERGDLPQAVGQLEQALMLAPRHRAARVALSHALLRLGRAQEAESQVATLRRLFPGDAETNFLSALVAFQQGRLEQVAELLNQSLARGDRRAEVYKLLALAEFLLDRPEQCEAHLRAALERSPLDADAHYHLGRLLFERKRYGAALESFQAALKLQPEHFKARYYAGLVYDGTDEPARAKEEWRAAIEIIERRRIRYAWPFADLGQRLVKDGEYENGLGWLYRATRNDPGSPHAWYGYAKALFQKEATAEVKDALLAAIKLDPGYSEAHYLLARYYQKTGETERAKETFARFDELKKNPQPSPYGLRRW